MRTWLTLLGLRPARKVRLSSVLMKAVAPVSAIKSFPPSCSKMVLGTIKLVILAILLVSPLLAGCDAGTRALPRTRCPLVALSPSGDLFFHARDLFFRAKPLWGSINGGSNAARKSGEDHYDKFSLPTGSGFIENILKVRARGFVSDAEFGLGGPQCFSCHEMNC